MTTRFRSALLESGWQEVEVVEGMLTDRLKRQVVWGITTEGEMRMSIRIQKEGHVIGEFDDANPFARDPVLGFRLYRLAEELNLVNKNSWGSLFLAAIEMSGLQSAAQSMPGAADRTASFVATFRESGVIHPNTMDKIATESPMNLLDLARHIQTVGDLSLVGMIAEVDQGRLTLTSELRRLGVESTANLEARRGRLQKQADKYGPLLDEYLKSIGHTCAICKDGLFSFLQQGLARGLEGAELVGSALVRWHELTSVTNVESMAKKIFGPEVQAVHVVVVGGPSCMSEPFNREQAIEVVAGWVGSKMSTQSSALTAQLRTLYSGWNTMPIVVE